MENWDEKKLEEVVNKKHGEAEKIKPKTQIVRPSLAHVHAHIPVNAHRLRGRSHQEL